MSGAERVIHSIKIKLDILGRPSKEWLLKLNCGIRTTVKGWKKKLKKSRWSLGSDSFTSVFVFFSLKETDTGFCLCKKITGNSNQ